MPKHANPERERPTMASHRLDLPSRCDICGKARSTRKHQTCSRIRQQHKSAEWAAYMAEREAANRKRHRFVCEIQGDGAKPAEHKTQPAFIHQSFRM